MTNKHDIPQIKICGLTRISEAQACVALGASAIGCVFYPPSPRNLTLDKARDICASLPSTAVTVGVFANAPFEQIMDTVHYCALTAVQLSGQEPGELVTRLNREKIPVIKALFSARQPYLAEADLYSPAAYLAEYGQGKLPGGNAEQWNWQEARRLAQIHPLVLAGGLSADNVAQAISACEPDAVDVSSGVESAPGRKDLDRVKNFIDTVKRCPLSRTIRRIF